MPRQDVPYGGAICRLKERIAEIWDELGKKLHSINGVEGDGQGDVKIVSGDAAIVVTSDQVNHQIEVALDSSQLPAAAVSSVNGQTGAVALDAGDIPSDGNSDVQTDIDVNKAAISACSSAITSEQLARQNADSTLQGNINALSASIPTAAATAVANDPTVAQLTTDVPNKVDKITSGSSLKAYTHTGATQGETSVVDGTTANSIGIRDANGYLKAVSPATGVYDDNLANGTKVKNELDNYAPMIRTTGNQASVGIKSFESLIKCSYHFRLTGANKIEIGRMSPVTNTFIYLMIHSRSNGSVFGMVTFTLDANNEIDYVNKSFYGSSINEAGRIYLYKEDGNIILAIGNDSAFNNYYSVTIMGAYSGAGTDRFINTDNAGRNVTNLVDPNYSVVISA